jgi:ABC-type lipoprotein release transport system permease subunit
VSNVARVIFFVAAAAGLVGAQAAADPAEPPGVLLSRQLVEAAGLSPGDTVRLSADADGGRARSFRVVGVYEPVPDPMRITQSRHEARLHLSDLLELTADPDDPQARESVGAINVELAAATDAAAFARDLERKVPGLWVEPTATEDDAGNPFVVLERFHLAIAIVTVLGSTAFLLALMVMRADERRETVGVLRLIGLSRGRVLVAVFVEGLLVALAGALFGLALAALMQGGFNRFFQWRYDTALVFVRVTAEVAWRCILIAVPLGVLAGLVASWTLLRRGVLELIRR